MDEIRWGKETLQIIFMPTQILKFLFEFDKNAEFFNIMKLMV